MSHKNYTRYSKVMNDGGLKNVVEPETELVADACGLDGCCAAESENESASIEQPIEDQSVAQEIETVVAPETRKIGKVYGCKRLNVRETPNTTAAIVSEIVEGVEVMIDEQLSNGLFYKICTEHGIEGYCMKKFITICRN